MRTPLPSAILVAAALGLAAAVRAEEAPPLAPYQPPENHTRVIRLWGDRHMEALAEAWARAYRATHPDTSFEIKLLGNGTAMPALYLGLADLALFGRDLTVTDRDGFAHVLKYDPLQIGLGSGSLDSPGNSAALALFVRRDNPLQKLTLAQVDAIFSARRRRGAPAALRTWGDLGLTGEWANQPIRLYADDTQSMTGLFFQRVALGDSRMMNWEHFTEFRDIRHPDGTTTPAAAAIITALRADRYGLAVANLAYRDTQVKAVALAPRNDGRYYAPTRENLIAGDYPLTRPIFACVNRPPGRPLDPKVRAFLRFLVGPGGQAVLAAGGQYLPLAEDAARRELAKLP